MVDLNWPSDFLPEVPLIDGFRINVDTGLIRTPMEDGQARQRRRFQGPPSTIPASWIMDQSELTFFKSWIANLAGFGASWFNINLDMGEGISNYEARIVGKPEYVPVSHNKWRARISLEVRDDPQLSTEVLEVIISFGSINGVFDSAELLGDGNQIQPAIDTWQGFYPFPELPTQFPYFDPQPEFSYT